VRASTEELLYVLLWTADSCLRPSWRHALDPGGFESWAWRNGLGRRLAELERRKLVERMPELSHERVVRLTEHGRIAALGGRDPVNRWARPWDGRWRLVLFDLPVGEAGLRLKLWRILRAEHFGYLQHSVWLTPDPVGEARGILAAAPANPEGFFLFEGRPASGESDQAIVRGAWDFGEINQRYEEYLAVAHACPRRFTKDAAGFVHLQTWARREHAAWRQAVGRDPLLPLALLPRSYPKTSM